MLDEKEEVKEDILDATPITSQVANVADGIQVPKPNEESKEKEKEEKVSLTAEEIEELKKALLKKTNDELKEILKSANVPEEVFKDMVKKELVEEIS